MNTEITFDVSCLKIETNNGEIRKLYWSSVLEVFGFKDDVFAYDIISLGFRTSSQGDYTRVDEEDTGYAKLLAFLPEAFPGIREDWYVDVAFPAFQTCVTCLWGEPKIETLWADDEGKVEKGNTEIYASGKIRERKFVDKKVRTSCQVMWVGLFFTFSPEFILIFGRPYLGYDFIEVFLGAMLFSIFPGLPLWIASLWVSQRARVDKIKMTFLYLFIFVLHALFALDVLVSSVGISFTA